MDAILPVIDNVLAYVWHGVMLYTTTLYCGDNLIVSLISVI